VPYPGGFASAIKDGMDWDFAFSEFVVDPERKTLGKCPM
jgi:hypothetical protein